MYRVHLVGYSKPAGSNRWSCIRRARQDCLAVLSFHICPPYKDGVRRGILACCLAVSSFHFRWPDTVGSRQDVLPCPPTLEMVETNRLCDQARPLGLAYSRSAARRATFHGVGRQLLLRWRKHLQGSRWI